jgi:PTS system nitrogen regulatory IIA component
VITMDQLLGTDRCFTGLDLSSKKAALESVSRIIAQPLEGISYKVILEHLTERERLGSTAIGRGVAIPHARMNKINTPIGAFITLKKPIDFSSDDKIPVDLVFALLVPENLNQSHLQILASLAALFSDEERRHSLRDIHDAHTLRYKLIEYLNQLNYEH